MSTHSRSSKQRVEKRLSLLSLLWVAILFIFSLPVNGQIQRLSYSDLTQNGHFGKRHDVYGSHIIISEPNYSSIENERAGRTHIYERLGSQWIHSGKVEAPVEESSNYFGQDVAVHDQLLAISTPDITGGTIYLYELQNGESWSLVQEITIPDDLKKTGLHVRFGEQVVLNNEWLVVSAPGYPGTADLNIKTGALFVYQRSGEEWIFHQLILPEDKTRSTQFGYDLELSSSSLVVAAPKADGGASNSGVVFLYELENSSWVLDYTFINPASRSFELFGHDVDVSGNTIVIGVPMHTRADEDGPFGAAHVFQKHDETWIRTALLEADDSGRNDMFGHAVEVEDGRIAVGAPRYDHNALMDVGKTYLFRIDHGVWIETNSFIPPDEDLQSHIQFGSTLSLDSYQLVISGHLMNNTFDDSGIAYSWDLDFSVDTKELTSNSPTMQVLPNPSTTYFNVDLDAAWGSSSTITLYSADGMPISRRELNPSGMDNKWNYDATALAAGIYFIHVTNGRQVSIHKWVKL